MPCLGGGGGVSAGASLGGTAARAWTHTHRGWGGLESSSLGLLDAAGTVRKLVPAPRPPPPAPRLAHSVKCALGQNTAAPPSRPPTPPPRSPSPLTTGKFSFRKGKSRGTRSGGWKSSVGVTAHERPSADGWTRTQRSAQNGASASERKEILTPARTRMDLENRRRASQQRTNAETPRPRAPEWSNSCRQKGWRVSV